MVGGTVEESPAAQQPKLRKSALIFLFRRLTLCHPVPREAG
jgi:hypothetical protein